MSNIIQLTTFKHIISNKRLSTSRDIIIIPISEQDFETIKGNIENVSITYIIKNMIILHKNIILIFNNIYEELKNANEETIKELNIKLLTEHIIPNKEIYYIPANYNYQNDTCISMENERYKFQFKELYTAVEYFIYLLAKIGNPIYFAIIYK